ncbi:MAG: zinc ribbon domain-containing protein [Enterobacteriaceae bacterium]|nr:zinc ribbon domain-containing protein [Enterobacteriaceae bacterium]
MPIYEYQCDSCNYKLEKLHKSYKEKLIIICPNCNMETLNKIISITSFQLKGTGWYATDFKNKSLPIKNIKK